MLGVCALCIVSVPACVNCYVHVSMLAKRYQTNTIYGV